MIDFLKYVEETYPVNEISVNDISIWPILRTQFYVAYGNKHLSMYWKSQTDHFNYNRLNFKKISDLVISLFKAHSQYDKILFSESNERVLIDGKLRDKLFHNIMREENLNQLYCELPVSKSYYSELVDNKDKRCNSLLFYYLKKIIINKKQKISGKEILDKIIDEFKLQIDYKKNISDFLKYLKVANYFINIWKPNKIFIKCYYSTLNQAFIYVANKKNIKTIELQHGLISKSHPSYNIFTDLNRDCFPFEIYTFSQLEKNILEKKYSIYENVTPHGNYIIERTKKNLNVSLNKNKRILVSLQDTVEDELVNFIIKIAKHYPDYLFILLPRCKLDLNLELKQSNIYINNKDSFYDLITNVEVHCTVYSTCAYESYLLGIPNILVDIRGLSSTYYDKLLPLNNYNYIVSNGIEFKKALNEIVRNV